MGERERPQKLIMAISVFIDWLYDECPVNPDEVTRDKLYELWDLWYDDKPIPTREEILPHARYTNAERKAKLFHILK